jgi:hypothetical protein
MIVDSVVLYCSVQCSNCMVYGMVWYGMVG